MRPTGPILRVRIVLQALAAAGVLVLLSGSSCVVHYESCHDDDFDHDCDGHARTLLPATGVRLERAELVRSRAPGRHPIRLVRGIEGIAVPASEPDGPVARDYRALANAVLAANPALLGLPPEAGVLAPAEVLRDGDGVRVLFLQLAERDGAVRAVPDASVTFRFDGRARLRVIENTTVLVAGG